MSRVTGAYKYILSDWELLVLTDDGSRYMLESFYSGTPIEHKFAELGSGASREEMSVFFENNTRASCAGDNLIFLSLLKKEIISCKKKGVFNLFSA